MKRTDKKGFTIVELVIVIAVIAILAAVLIPNISRLVQKANASADESLVRNLNTALSMDVEKHTTMSAALKAAKDNGGYDLETIELKGKGNKILWDSVNDCFVYLKGKEKVYLPNTQSVKKEGDMKDYEYFEIVKEVPAVADQKYSIYLAGKSIIDTAEVSVGFDAGNNTVKTVVYTNTTSNAKDVIINTNDEATLLTVNAENDTVTHFGKVGTVNVVRVAMSSYHENGTVAGNINVAQGNVVVEATAKVSNVIVIALDDVQPATDKVSVKVVDAEKSGTKVQNTANVDVKVDGVTKETATVVKTADALLNAVKNGGNVVLGADITSSVSVERDVVINLGNYTLKGKITVTAGVLTLEGNGNVVNSGTVVSIDKTGKAIVNGGSYTSGYVAFSVGGSVGGGELIFNTGSVVAQEACIGGFLNGKIEINGGVFTSKDNFVVGTNGSSNFGNNEITINGGEFNGYIKTSGYIACGVYLANSDTLTVNGGVFNITNGCGILVRAGNATIEKVEINLTADGKVSSGKIGDSTIKVDAAATIVVDSRSGYPGGMPNLVKNESGYTVQEIN